MGTGSTCCCQHATQVHAAHAQVTSVEEASLWLAKGAQARACAETAHNQHSSRSHALVLVSVHGRCKLTGDPIQAFQTTRPVADQRRACLGMRDRRPGCASLLPPQRMCDCLQDTPKWGRIAERWCPQSLLHPPHI